MAVVPLLTKQYAVCCYNYGTRKFDTIPLIYHEPVKQYAAENYTLEQIDYALAQGYISESEYVDTIAYTK